jgi:hypothetical protein
MARARVNEAIAALVELRTHPAVSPIIRSMIHDHDGTVAIQFLGFAIVLLPNSTYFLDDTSGG